MNFADPMLRPTLTEPGVKYFLDRTLKQTHEVRMKFHNAVYNAGLLILFVGLLVSILYFKYKGRPSEEELRDKDRAKQEYILERIKAFNRNKLQAQQALITGLPHWENEYSMLHNQRVLF